MLARPLMREKHRPDMSEEEAVALMQECLKVCVICCFPWRLFWRVPFEASAH